MKYIYTSLWLVAVLLLVWGLGVRQGERAQLARGAPSVTCIDPQSLFGRDSPAIRLYLYSLNPNVCFPRGITEKPELVGLVGAGSAYRLW